MTEHSKAVAKQKKKLKAEELSTKIEYIYFQRGAGKHYSKIKYKDGSSVTTNYEDANQ
tara:strand:+ start:141 stop:314 length:174 start_codon:yes stop_codon:yes gene_type:complete